MGTFLWLMLLFPGVCGLSSSVPRQFHVVKEDKTWTQAQQYCREKFTDLATIDDMAEMKKLNRIIQKEGVQYAWIGLNYGSSPKWQWSLADRDFYRENEAEFRNWGSGQPGGRVGGCVFIWLGGEWYDFDCSSKKPFICYVATGTPNSKHPYVLIEDGKTWRDAQRYCREHYTDLASVRNQAENDQIEAVRTPGGGDAWIGLFQDAWQWSDGSSSSFRHWRQGEPSGPGNEPCAEIWPSGQWNDNWCGYKGRNFICYEDNLVLVRENKTWMDALQYCREHHVDLVSVTSEKIQRWVEGRAIGASSTHVWMGLRYECSFGFWFWVNGYSVCYNNWAPKTESEHCCETRGGAVDRDGGKWLRLDENEKLNFICTTKE